MATKDWTQFTRRIRIKTPIDSVYEAWVKPQKLTSWFLKSVDVSNREIRESDSLQTGDQSIWRWNNYEHPEEVTILSANGMDEFVFTFGHGMEVSVTLSKEESFTVISLRQYNIPSDDDGKMNYYLGCSQAWSTWMLNLKAYLEYGILLHDTTLGMRKNLFTFVNT